MRTARSAILAGLLTLSASATAGDFLELRNYHPFLRVFGAPTFRADALTPEGELRHHWSFDLANHANQGALPDEAIVLDGEGYVLEWSARYGLGERVELDLAVPLVGYASGLLDNAIDEWHDLIGAPEGFRNGPNNQLRIAYVRDGAFRFDLTDDSAGLGDLRLGVAVGLGEPREDRGLTARLAVKLPTGDPDDLHGSGGVDSSAVLAYRREWTVAGRGLGLGLDAGITHLGASDVLPDLQKTWVPSAGAGLRWGVTDNAALLVQLHLQGAYFDSELDELGGVTSQLGLGGAVRLPAAGLELAVGVVEDLDTDSTPDVVFHLELRTRRD